MDTEASLVSQHLVLDRLSSQTPDWARFGPGLVRVLLGRREV